MDCIKEIEERYLEFIGPVFYVKKYETENSSFREIAMRVLELHIEAIRHRGKYRMIQYNILDSNTFESSIFTQENLQKADIEKIIYPVLLNGQIPFFDQLLLIDGKVYKKILEDIESNIS